MAYGRIYSNKGAMTPGATGETADGMSMEKIERIIDALRHERYRFSLVRRIYIPKKNGKLRPLGMPSWSDKLAGEVVRLLLEAYYEPRFSDRSHGFRKRHGCHTALREIHNTWTGVTWFIEGDISDCFGSLDHDIMVGILAEKIHDNRFLRLLRNMLQAGYLEDWIWGATLSGAPQGGVASPILSNIYLHRLDVFAETVLIPQYTRGVRRVSNPEYTRMASAVERARKRGDREKVRELRKRLRSLPSLNPQDPGYRRLRYARYADDHLLGFTGPKAEAEEIKARLAQFLRDDLKLELSQEKTLITHASTEAAKFLGYEITVQRSNQKVTRGRRSVNGSVDADGQQEASWRERALNTEAALKAAHAEIRTQRGRIAALMGQARDTESEWTPQAIGRVTSENTTLKQRVRQLTQDNRALQEQLHAARSNVRFADRRIAQLEAQLLDHRPGPLS